VDHVAGHHRAGQVQVVEQGPEPGDLVGGAIDVGLAQDGTAGVVHHREQVDLRGRGWPT
jgi:hypothetical protein